MDFRGYQEKNRTGIKYSAAFGQLFACRKKVDDGKIFRAD